MILIVSFKKKQLFETHFGLITETSIIACPGKEKKYDLFTKQVTISKRSIIRWLIKMMQQSYQKETLINEDNFIMNSICLIVLRIKENILNIFVGTKEILLMLKGCLFSFLSLIYNAKL